MIVVDLDDRQRLINLISGAEYYISASQIENSSIAALEGFILSKNIVVSGIPSHREMLKDYEYDEILETKTNTKFFISSFNKKIDEKSFTSWDEAISQLKYILDKYRESL